MNWSQEFEPNEKSNHNHCLAETPLGEARIEWKTWKDKAVYVIYIEGTYVDHEYTLKKAKGVVRNHLKNTAMTILDFLKDPKLIQ